MFYCQYLPVGPLSDHRALPHMGSSTVSPGCSSAERAMAQATGADMPGEDTSPPRRTKLWISAIDIYTEISV